MPHHTRTAWSLSNMPTMTPDGGSGRTTKNGYGLINASDPTDSRSLESGTIQGLKCGKILNYDLRDTFH